MVELKLQVSKGNIASECREIELSKNRIDVEKPRCLCIEAGFGCISMPSFKLTIRARNAKIANEFLPMNNDFVLFGATATESWPIGPDVA